MQKWSSSVSIGLLAMACLWGGVARAESSSRALDAVRLVGDWQFQRDLGDIGIWTRANVHSTQGPFRQRMVLHADGRAEVAFRWHRPVHCPDGPPPPDETRLAPGTYRLVGRTIHVEWMEEQWGSPGQQVSARYEVVGIQGDELRLRRVP